MFCGSTFVVIFCKLFSAGFFVLLDKKSFTGLTLLTVIQFVIFESYKLRFSS